MSKLSGVNSAAVRSAIANMVFGSAGLAQNAAGVDIGEFQYSIDGLAYAMEAVTGQSLAVTHDAFGNAIESTASFGAYVQPAGTRVVYLLSANADGDVAVTQGTYLDQELPLASDLSKILTGTGDVPQEPDGFTVFGAIVVETAGEATFEPGETELDEDDITATIHNISVLPTGL